jgi:hypothetical protein
MSDPTTPALPDAKLTDAQIQDLRRRIDAGETVTNEEILAGLNAIRVARLNAASAAPRAKAVTITPIKLDLATLLAKKNLG